MKRQNHKKLIFSKRLLITLLFGFVSIAIANPGAPAGYEHVHPLDYALSQKQRQVDEKLVGGRNASTGEFPWQVSIRFIDANNPDGLHFCGGTLLKDNWVITATHCFDRRPGENGKLRRIKKEDLLIASGDVDQNSLPFTSKVLKLIGNPKFVSPFLGGDIALLKLESSIESAGKSEPIDLPQPNLSWKHKDNLVLTGWGYTGSDEESPGLLQALDNFPLVGDKFCSHGLNISTSLAKKLICAGEPGGNNNACQGDSGGPMLLKNQSGTYLIGVISFRPSKAACGRPARYTVSTRISQNLGWLLETIESN
jgi:secreted trypsin-like serine protease